MIFQTSDHTGSKAVTNLNVRAEAVEAIRALHDATTQSTQRLTNSNVAWTLTEETGVQAVTKTGLVAMFYAAEDKEGEEEFSFESTLLESTDGTTVETIRIGGASYAPEDLDAVGNEVMFILEGDDRETGWISLGNTPFDTSMGSMVSDMGNFLETDEDLDEDETLVITSYAYAQLGRTLRIEHVENGYEPHPYTVVKATVSGVSTSPTWTDEAHWDVSDPTVTGQHTPQEIIAANGIPQKIKTSLMPRTTNSLWSPSSSR